MTEENVKKESLPGEKRMIFPLSARGLKTDQYRLSSTTGNPADGNKRIY